MNIHSCQLRFDLGTAKERTVLCWRYEQMLSTYEKWAISTEHCAENNTIDQIDVEVNNPSSRRHIRYERRRKVSGSIFTRRSYIEHDVPRLVHDSWNNNSWARWARSVHWRHRCYSRWDPCWYLAWVYFDRVHLTVRKISVSLDREQDSEENRIRYGTSQRGSLLWEFASEHRPMSSSILFRTLLRRDAEAWCAPWRIRCLCFHLGYSGTELFHASARTPGTDLAATGIRAGWTRYSSPGF